MRLVRCYAFEAAHQLSGLPADHPCTRLHGHGYRLEVCVMGDPDDRGMVIEYAELDAIVERAVLAIYDHHFINDFIDQPTVENMVVDIFGRLDKENPVDRWCFARIRLWETERSSVEYP